MTSDTRTCLTLEEIFFFHGSAVPGGSGPPHYRGFTITPRYAALGSNPLDE